MTSIQPFFYDCLTQGDRSLEQTKRSPVQDRFSKLNVFAATIGTELKRREEEAAQEQARLEEEKEYDSEWEDAEADTTKASKPRTVKAYAGEVFATLRELDQKCNYNSTVSGSCAFKEAIEKYQDPDGTFTAYLASGNMPEPGSRDRYDEAILQFRAVVDEIEMSHDQSWHSQVSTARGSRAIEELREPDYFSQLIGDGCVDFGSFIGRFAAGVTLEMIGARKKPSISSSQRM